SRERREVPAAEQPAQPDTERDEQNDVQDEVDPAQITADDAECRSWYATVGWPKRRGPNQHDGRQHECRRPAPRNGHGSWSAAGPLLHLEVARGNAALSRPPPTKPSYVVRRWPGRGLRGTTLPPPASHASNSRRVIPVVSTRRGS